MHPKAKLGAVAAGGGWGADINPVAEVTRVVCVADVANSLNGKHFVIYDEAGSVAVWLNSGGASAPGGFNRTLEVPFVTNDVAEDICAQVYYAVLTDAAWDGVQIDAAEFTVADVATGARIDASDVDTGFTITITTQGV